jgi:hypothetical protein
VFNQGDKPFKALEQVLQDRPLAAVQIILAIFAVEALGQFNQVKPGAAPGEPSPHFPHSPIPLGGRPPISLSYFHPILITFYFSFLFLFFAVFFNSLFFSLCLI